MKRPFLALLVLGVACAKAPTQAPAEATAPKLETKAELGAWGIDLSAKKESVKPGDDFFTYANGAWLDSYTLKDDQLRFGSFIALRDRSDERVRAIIDELAGTDPAPGSLEQKIGDAYVSWMDGATLNEKGLAPIQDDLDRFAAIKTKEDVIAAFGWGRRVQSAAPIGWYISTDRKLPDRRLVTVTQSGLGLPDKSYYAGDDERFTAIRAAYVENIAAFLVKSGMEEVKANAAAKEVLALETRLAAVHWERAELRNRDKTYNPFTLEELATEFTGFDWNTVFAEGGLSLADIKKVVVSPPSAIKGIIKVVNDTPPATWRNHMTYRFLVNHAQFLGDELDALAFEFYGKTLNGQKSQKPRWQRGVSLVGSRRALGIAIGKVYVERHFPPEAKAAMLALVENLRAAYKERIEKLEWMGGETKEQALKKLAAFNPQIGYPDKWEDLSSIAISSGDLIGNIRAIREFWYQKNLDDLNRPTDKTEWFMTPQTVNAYYSSSFNQITFPAAILQPPFFDLYADPAVNYGAIGAVIGHEMGHGFDDQGSKTDYEGVERNWWTEDDRKNFEGRTQRLVEQYNQYSPLEGQNVNGSLTLGENIGDLGGLSVAYHAYKLSLGGKPAPVIDGLTGDQRFFLSYAQVWKGKDRPEFALRRLKTDPHSPAKFRVNGAVRNIPAWYAAFGVKEGDALYLPEDERVAIW